MQNKIMFNNPPTAAAAAPKKRRPRKKVEMPQDEEAERQERELRMKIAQSLHTQQVMRTEVELEDNAAHRLSSGSGGDGVGGGNNNNNNKEVMPDGFIRFMAQEQRVDMGMMLPPQDRQYLQHQQNNNGGQWEDENGGGGGGGDNNYPYSRGNSGGSGHGRGYHGNNNHNMYHNNGQMTERQPNWNSNNEGQHLQNRHEDFGNKITREEILLSLKHEQERLLTEALKLKAMVENRVHQQHNHHPQQQQQQQQQPPSTRDGFSPAPGYSQSSSPGLYNQSPSPDNIDRMYQRNNSNEYNSHYTTSPSPGGDRLQHPNNSNSINSSNFNQQYNPHPASPSPVADRMQHANNNTNNFNQQDFNGIQHQHNNNGNNNIFTNDQNQQYNSINGYPNQYNNNSNNNRHHQQQCQISSRTQAPKDTRCPGTPTICNVTGNNNALNKEQQQQFRQQMQQFSQELHQQRQQEQHQQQQAGHNQEMPQPSQSRWQQDQQQLKPAPANEVNDEHKNSLTMQELHSLLTQQQQQKNQLQRETGHNQEMPQQTQSRWQPDQQQRKPASANKVNDEHKNSLTTKDLHSLLSSGQGLTANYANSGPYQDQQQPNPPFANNGNHEASKEFEILMSGRGMTATGLTSSADSKSRRSSMFHSVGTITSSFQSSMLESIGSLVFEPEGESPNKTPDGVMLGPVEEEGTLDFSDRMKGSDYESRYDSVSTNNVSHGGNGNLTAANAVRTKGDSNCTVVNVNTAEVTEIESKPSRTNSEDDVMNSLMASAMNRSLMDSNLLGDSKLGDNMGASSKSFDFMMSMDSLAFHDFKKSDMNMSLSDLIEEDDADLSSAADGGNAKGSKGQMFRKPPPSRGSAARGSETSSITMENVNGKTLRESRESHGSSISTSCRSLRSQASKGSVVDQQTMMSEISQWTSSNPFDNSLSGNMDLANAPDSRGQEGRQRESINKRIFDFNDFESFNGSVDDFNLSLMSSVTETDLNNSLKALDLDPTRSKK